MGINEPTLKESGIQDVRFGTHVTVVKPVNLYGCAIGDNCFIGPFVEIQKEVSIGAFTRVQSHTFICEGVIILEYFFFCLCIMFIYDLLVTNISLLLIFCY